LEYDAVLVNTGCVLRITVSVTVCGLSADNGGDPLSRAETWN